MRRAIQGLWEGLTGLYQRLLRDDVFVLTASIAYAAILSVFPILIALMTLLTPFVEQGRTRQAIIDALASNLPPGVVESIVDALDAALTSRGTAGVLAVLGLFWTATAVASAVRHSLNRVLHAPQPRSFWLRKAVEFAMVVLAGALLSLSLIVGAISPLFNVFSRLPVVPDLLYRMPGVAIIANLGEWILASSAFFVIYRFLPNVRAPLGPILAGSVTAVVLFEASRRAFFWYLGSLAHYPLVYGPLAGFVVFMIWVYLVALVLLIGAEVIASLSGADGNRLKSACRISYCGGGRGYPS